MVLYLFVTLGHLRPSHGPPTYMMYFGVLLALVRFSFPFFRRGSVKGAPSPGASLKLALRKEPREVGVTNGDAQGQRYQAMEQAPHTARSVDLYRPSTMPACWRTS